MSTTEYEKPAILAVDDSRLMQDLIRQELEDKYQVWVAGNATDALALLYREPIVVVLLDVAMPGVDGLELCRSLRSLPQFQQLPIIMITSRDSTFDKVQGRMAGATEYLVKPIEAEHLRQTVDKFVAIGSC